MPVCRPYLLRMRTYYGRPRPDDYYCNYCARGKFKLGGAPGCYDAGESLSAHAILAVRAIKSITKDIVLSARFAAILKRRFL